LFSFSQKTLLVFIIRFFKIVFFSFILFIWLIIIIEFLTLNQPYLSRINSTWSWCFVLFWYCWILLANTLSFFCGRTGVWTQGFVLTKQLYCLSHTSSPFCSGYFGDGVSHTICLGWPRTLILFISSSQVARITGVSHQHLALLANILPRMFASMFMRNVSL
jgi:hypothetical protein